MNILVIGEKGTWFDSHIVGSLVGLGHKVTVFHYGRAVGEFYSWRRHEERVEKNRRLVDLATRLVSDHGLDLIFAYAYDDFLLPASGKAIERLGVPAVNLNVDMSTQWYRQSRTARFFSVMLCSHRENMDHLARYSKAVLYFPMAAMPPPHYSRDDLSFSNLTSSAVFVGTVASERAAILSRVARAGLPLTIFGKRHVAMESDKARDGLEKLVKDIIAYAVPKIRSDGITAITRGFGRRRFRNEWALDQYMRGRVRDGMLQAVFQHSGINLGINRMTAGPVERPGRCQMKLRDFEVTAAGGFYMVEKSPGYDNLFREGEHFISWKTPDEMIEKCQHYLAAPEERRAIGNAAKEHCLTHHLWEHRFDMLFRYLRLSDGEKA